VFLTYRSLDFKITPRTWCPDEDAPRIQSRFRMMTRADCRRGSLWPILEHVILPIINDIHSIPAICRLFRGNSDMEQLWDAGGRLYGQAEQNWLAAEREVLEQSNTEVDATSSGVSTPRQKRSGTKYWPQRRKVTSSKKPT